MVYGILNIGLGLLLLGLWGYIMYLTLDVSSSGYGGKYTTVLPYLLGGFTVLFTFQAVEVGYDLLLTGTPGEAFFFGLQTLQLIDGLLLVLAVYQLYQIEYVTTGFFDDEQLEGEP